MRSHPSRSAGRVAAWCIRRADRLRLRAIRWEAAARVGFVVATIASTVVGDPFAP